MLGTIGRVAATTVLAEEISVIAEVSETLVIVLAGETWATVQVEEMLLTALVEEILATTARAGEMPLIDRVEGTLETGQPGVEEIGLDPEIYPAAGAIEAAMHSEEAVVDLMDRERVRTAIAAHRAWRPAAAVAEEEGSGAEEAVAAEEGSEAAAEVVAEAAAADGADSGR